MGSIIDHKIGYKGEGVLRGQRHIPSENCPKYPPGGACSGTIVAVTYSVCRTKLLKQCCFAKWAQNLGCKQHCERRVSRKSFRFVYSCTIPRNFSHGLLFNGPSPRR